MGISHPFPAQVLAAGDARADARLLRELCAAALTCAGDCAARADPPRPGDAEDPGAAEEHRYPFSGATNPSVKFGVVGVSGGDVAWLDLTKAGLGEDTYLARVYWASDDIVLACVQSRDQRTMRLVAYDIDKGTDRVVLEETNKAWLNLNDCLRWGVVENEVLIASERDGVQHLYVHGTGDGKVLRRLTEGTDCVVEELIDIQNGLVYYLGGDVEPAKCTERHLFSVPYDGSSPVSYTHLTLPTKA